MPITPAPIGMSSNLGLFNTGLAQGFQFSKRAQMVGGLPPRPTAAPVAAAPAASAPSGTMQTLRNDFSAMTDTLRPVAPTPTFQGEGAPTPAPPPAPGSMTGVPFVDRMIDNLATPQAPTAAGRAADMGGPNGPGMRPRIGDRPAAPPPTAAAVAQMDGGGRGNEAPLSTAGAMPAPPTWAQQFPGQMPAPPEWARQFPGTEGVAVASSAPGSAATPMPPSRPGTAPAATTAMRTPTPKPAQGDPGDMMWSARGPGGRLIAVRRDALRPGEEAFAVTENTIGVRNREPSGAAPVAAPATPGAVATPRPRPAEAPGMPPPMPRAKPGVATVPDAPAEPVRGMGGPLTRGGRRRPADAGADALVGGSGSDALKGGDGDDQLITRYSPEVNAALSAAAKKHGVSPSYLEKTTWIESKGDPKAKNPRSSAGGLGQFIDSTAKQYGLTNKFDPNASADAMARLAVDNGNYLRKRLGRDPTDGELYLAHQQGAGGAVKLLANPGRPAIDVVGAAAFKLNGGKPGMTAGEFANLWTKKLDAAGGKGRVKVSGSVETDGAPAPAAEREPAAAETKAADRRKEIADTLTSTAGSIMGGGGGGGGGGSAPQQAAPVTGRTESLDPPAIGPPPAAETLAARALAGQGLPSTVKASSKSNTWAALKAAMTKES